MIRPTTERARQRKLTAARQERRRQKLHGQGLERLELWVRPENKAAVIAAAQALDRDASP